MVQENKCILNTWSSILLFFNLIKVSSGIDCYHCVTKFCHVDLGKWKRCDREITEGCSLIAACYSFKNYEWGCGVVRFCEIPSKNMTCEKALNEAIEKAKTHLLGNYINASLVDHRCVKHTCKESMCNDKTWADQASLQAFLTRTERTGKKPLLVSTAYSVHYISFFVYILWIALHIL